MYTYSLKSFWIFVALAALELAALDLAAAAGFKTVMNPASNYMDAALEVEQRSALQLKAAMKLTHNHMTGQACSDCHLAGDDVNDENARMLVDAQEKLCATTCHPKSVKVSHPSGIKPTLSVPPTYPLDWKGNITCSTCHNVHGSTPGLMRVSLRGRKFCLSCHEKTFFSQMADTGASMISSGHVSSVIPKLDLTGLDTDAFTVQCMGCHVSHGDPRGAENGAGKILRQSGNSVPHSVGVRYSEFFQKGRFKHESAVNQRLFLPEGLVSCVSCHLGYTKEHGKLRVGKQRSALCLECHDR